MKNVITLIVATMVALIVTGCGNKVATVAPQATKYQGENVEVYTTMIDMRDGRSLSRAYEASVGATTALERTARATIEAGHTHFAIWAPYRVSNYKGSTINTFKEFKEQCVAGAFKSVVSAFDAFGIGENGCGIAHSGNQNIAFIDYKMYDGPQDEFLTWDAQALISEIEAAGESNNAGWEMISRTRDNSWTYQNADRIWYGAHLGWTKSQRTRE